MRRSKLRWTPLTALALCLLLHLLQETNAMPPKGTPSRGDFKCAPDFLSGAHKTDTYNKQLILTSFVFDCSAVITKWEAKIKGNRPSEMEFQVWRLVQSQYVLVGKNTYSTSTGGSKRRNELTLPVSAQLHQITVQPGDIAGIFISPGSGDYKIEFDRHMRDMNDITTYIVDRDTPLSGAFDRADLNNEDTFREVDGAPLIRVSVKELEVQPSQVVPMPAETIETTKTSLATIHVYTSSYHDTSTTIVPTVQLQSSSTMQLTDVHTTSPAASLPAATTSYSTQSAILPTTPGTSGKRSTNSSLWREHQSLFISVVVCGFLLVVLCVAFCVMMGLYVNVRWKQRDIHDERRPEENRDSHSSMFSLISMDTVRRKHLIAFKKRQTAPKPDAPAGGASVNSTTTDLQLARVPGRDDTDYEDMYDLASSTKIVTTSPPQNAVATTGAGKSELHISMKENPSYMVPSEKYPAAKRSGVPAAQASEMEHSVSENVYDVPVFSRPPPCEYEVPVSGSFEMSASYVNPISQPAVFYENTAEKSNTYTEIDI